VRSDRGGEYYGRYTELGQHLGPFARFLQEHGIVAQYTMPGTPDQNGVAERRIRTLMDMVRSMIGYSTLPISLWGDALKTVVYILNRAMNNMNSSKWYDAMKDEIESMDKKNVWNLVELPHGATTVSCKWVFKTKRDFKSNVE
jgi:transposase InsO family protein